MSLKNDMLRLLCVEDRPHCGACKNLSHPASAHGAVLQLSCELLVAMPRSITLPHLVAGLEALGIQNVEAAMVIDVFRPMKHGMETMHRDGAIAGAADSDKLLDVGHGCPLCLLG